jgi:sec-independent protein translocase protein TatA
MGGLSPWHLLILAVIGLLLFGGRVKLSSIMGDAAKGIKAFRDGLKDEHDATNATATSAGAPAPTALPSVEKEKDPVVR